MRRTSLGPADKLWVCPWWDQTLAPTRGGSQYTASSGAQDGVNLGTAVRRTQRVDLSGDGVEPGHTLRSRDRPKGAHAVEFSKTVAPLRKGIPSSRRVQEPPGFPERTDEYSARSPADGSGAEEIPKGSSASLKCLQKPRRNAADVWTGWECRPTRTDVFPSTTPPARSRHAVLGGRRSRPARPAATYRATAGRRRAGSSRRGR
jgi:hypothetical protein